MVYNPAYNQILQTKETKTKSCQNAALCSELPSISCNTGSALTFRQNKWSLRPFVKPWANDQIKVLVKWPFFNRNVPFSIERYLVSCLFFSMGYLQCPFIGFLNLHLPECHLQNSDQKCCVFQLSRSRFCRWQQNSSKFRRNFWRFEFPPSGILYSKFRAEMVCFFNFSG